MELQMALKFLEMFNTNVKEILSIIIRSGSYVIQKYFKRFIKKITIVCMKIYL